MSNQDTAKQLVNFIQAKGELIEVEGVIPYDEWQATLKEYFWYNHPTKQGFKYKVRISDLKNKELELKNKSKQYE